MCGVTDVIQTIVWVVPRLTKAQLEARLDQLLDEVQRLREELSVGPDDPRDSHPKVNSPAPTSWTPASTSNKRAPRTKAQAWNEFWQLLAEFEVYGYRRPWPAHPRPPWADGAPDSPAREE